MGMGFSVIMPTYNQAYFIRRAITSLINQTFHEWELIIVNDGCTDATEEFIQDFLKHPQIKYIKNGINKGLGYSLNRGIALANYKYITYLPSDDYYYRDHLESIAAKFEENPNAILVVSGIKATTPDTFTKLPLWESINILPGFSLQLVQTSHKKTEDRWMEREEWVTDDLFDMFWHKLTDKGLFAFTNKISCYWTYHATQRHSIIGENYGGGINRYRRYYNVTTPLKVKVCKYKTINEIELYKDYRQTLPLPEKPLKILIVGELTYNPERIYALEEAGCKLYGLWVDKPVFSCTTVGPLPFGHVEEVPRANWIARINEIQPDVIYGLLNFGAVSLAYEVIQAFPKIPFVWHFKEGPFACLRQGLWDQLMYIYHHAAAKIYINKFVKEWIEQFVPQGSALSYIMDGDLPKKDYFYNTFSPRLSEQDGEIHTLCAGRLIGIDEDVMKLLAENKIHVHVYSENYHDAKETQFQLLRQVAPRHFHVHNHCPQNKWTEEFSKYDAGWLHCVKSNNDGEILKASWDDLNIPARLTTYAAAGIPVILENNFGHINATQQIVRDFNIGIFYNDFKDLCMKLKEAKAISLYRTNMQQHRDYFTFEYHMPGLIRVFKQVSNKYENE